MANDAPNGKVYIHELVAIRDQNRQRYMEHVAVNWCPVGRVERNMVSFGIWGTVGSTGRLARGGADVGARRLARAGRQLRA